MLIRLHGFFGISNIFQMYFLENKDKHLLGRYESAIRSILEQTDLQDYKIEIVASAISFAKSKVAPYAIVQYDSRKENSKQLMQVVGAIQDLGLEVRVPVPVQVFAAGDKEAAGTYKSLLARFHSEGHENDS